MAFTTSNKKIHVMRGLPDCGLRDGLKLLVLVDSRVKELKYEQFAGVKRVFIPIKMIKNEDII